MMKPGALMIPVAMLALSFSFVSPSVNADELTEKCDECHGKNGNSESQKVASIAGFSAVVISDVLNQFKDGDRPAVKYTPEGGEETDMGEIASKLSDDQIEAVAEHYSKQTFKPVKQDFDSALVKKGAKVHKKRCEKCHSEGGTNAEDDAAILAGQWRAYLEEQFELIASQDRVVPKKMRKRFKKLDEDDIKAVIEYYISQQ